MSTDAFSKNEHQPVVLLGGKRRSSGGSYVLVHVLLLLRRARRKRKLAVQRHLACAENGAARCVQLVRPNDTNTKQSESVVRFPVVIQPKKAKGETLSRLATVLLLCVVIRRSSFVCTWSALRVRKLL
jgi:hypothetical protein